MAFFLVRSVVAIYIMQADEVHGLHFTAMQRGRSRVVGSLPVHPAHGHAAGMPTATATRRHLAFSVTVNICGYVLMAYTTSFWGFFAAIMVLATGTAFFKPSLQGSLARTSPRRTPRWAGASSTGSSTWARPSRCWPPRPPRVLLAHPLPTAAGITCLNYLMLLTFKDFQSGSDKPATRSRCSWCTLQEHLPGPADQLAAHHVLLLADDVPAWDLHPNFITDWIDSSPLAGGSRGGLPPRELDAP